MHRTNVTLGLGVLLILLGCASDSLPRSVAPAEGRVLLRGATVGDTTVLIRSIDGGEVLFVRGYELGSEAWIDPGDHTVSVMCRTPSGGVLALRPGEASFSAEAGSVYTIEPTSAQPESRRCPVDVRAEGSE